MNLRAFQTLLHQSSLPRQTWPETRGAFGGTVKKGRVRGVPLSKSLAFKIRQARLDARINLKLSKLPVE